MNLFPKKTTLLQKPIKIILLFLSLLSTSLSCAQDYKVVILLGQSNMVGFGRISDLNSMIQNLPQNIAEKVTIPPYYIWEDVENNRKESKAWKSLITHKDARQTLFQFLPTYGGGTPMHGSELGLAYQLNQYQPDTNFAFIKIAVSDTDLATDWKPPESQEAPSGPMYNRFEKGFNLAIEQAHAAVGDASIDIAGVLWVQGEKDSGNENQAFAYQKNLENFMSQVRHLVHNTNKDYIVNKPGSPEVPFIIGLTTDQESLDINCTSPDIPSDYQLLYADMIRQSQQDACNASERCSYFDTKDYQRACGYNAEIHYHSNSLNEMGFTFATHLNDFLK